MNEVHTPVLLKEIIEIFDPQPGEKYIDATINGGGHSAAILERISPGGLLLGIDWDCELIKAAKIQITKSKFQSDKIILECDNYANLELISAKHNFGPADGIIFDLGFSSHHLEESKRGFSFLRREPLDMRYSPQTNELTAEKIVNTYTGKAIENILRQYGEERFAKRISEEIVRARVSRKITATDELAGIVARSVPGSGVKSRLHPATRTFQALRIAVNKELENLERALPQISAVLASGAVATVISFHSLEDRIVKNFFKTKEKEGLFKIITKKPITAQANEIKENPRARSAKLRAAQKV